MMSPCGPLCQSNGAEVGTAINGFLKFEGKNQGNIFNKDISREAKLRVRNKNYRFFDAKLRFALFAFFSVSF
jgi:hypothetical protein